MKLIRFSLPCLYISVPVYVPLYVCMYVCVYVCMYVQIYMYIYVWMYVVMYVWAFIYLITFTPILPDHYRGIFTIWQYYFKPLQTQYFFLLPS